MSSPLSSQRLDAILQQPLPAEEAALSRLHQRLRLEPELRARPSWKRDALLLWGASMATMVLIAAIMFLTSNTSAEMLLARSSTVVVLMAAAALCCWSALAPRRTWSRVAGVAGGLLAAGWMVLSRSHGLTYAPTMPEWFCSVSHFATALPPLLVALFVLRRVQTQLIRPLVAGIAVGTTGAMLGEIGCARGFFHVFLFHLSVWAVVAVVTLLISSRLKKQSYAP